MRIVILISLIIACRGQVLVNLFPFGDDVGDAKLPPADDYFSTVLLRLGRFKFGGTVYDQLYVSTNGLISFGQGVLQSTPSCGNFSVPVIHQYWADVDTRRNRLDNSPRIPEVYYRETLDENVLLEASRHLKLAFPDGNLEIPVWSFITTWYEVPFYAEILSNNERAEQDRRNTFQTVLVSTATTSYVIFSYKEITWTTSPASGSEGCALGGTSALAGYSLPYTNGYTFPGSGPREVLAVVNQTNMGVAGKFAFRVDIQNQFDPCLEEDRELEIEPKIIPSLGLQEVKLHGPCLAVAVTATCVLHDLNPLVISGTLSADKTSVKCFLPQLSKSGMLQLNLLIDSGNATETYSTVVFTTPFPSPSLSVIEIENPNLLLRLSWDPKYFEDRYLGPIPFLQLGIMAYSSESSEFTDIKDVAPWFGNNGSIDVTPNLQGSVELINLQYPYYYYLKPVPATIYLLSSLFTPVIGKSEQDFEQLCGEWYNEDPGPPPEEELIGCPPILSKMLINNQYEEEPLNPQVRYLAGTQLDNHVQYAQMNPSTKGHGQSCIYDRITGFLATGMPRAGTAHYVNQYDDTGYTGHYVADILPRIICCLRSQSCDMFVEKRPINTGHNDTGPGDPGDGGGDPHMITFDRVKYDFMGAGEFWLIWSPLTDIFQAQARMEPLGRPSVSYYTAFVLKQANTTVQFQFTSSSMVVLANGRSIPFSATGVTTIIDKTVAITTGQDQHLRPTIKADFGAGFTFSVTNINSVYLNLQMFIQSRHRDKQFMGILGHYDGDRENDLTTRDGFVLPINANLSLIHNQFGLSWMTTSEESLFIYEPGKSWEYYANPNFGPLLEYPNPADMPEEVQRICGNNLACYYDYVGTGDLDEAIITAERQAEHDEILKEIDKVVSMCNVGVPDPENGRAVIESYVVGSIANFKCNAEYEVDGEGQMECTLDDDNNSTATWVGVSPLCNWVCNACGEGSYVAHNPSNCTNFFYCIDGHRYHSYCPTGQVFNRVSLLCDSPNNYPCVDPPGC